jgi:hypothetical protein
MPDFSAKESKAGAQYITCLPCSLPRLIRLHAAYQRYHAEAALALPR